MASFDAHKINQALNDFGFNAKPAPALTIRQMEAAAVILGRFSGEHHPEVDGALRDEIGHVIFALEQAAERRRKK